MMKINKFQIFLEAIQALTSEQQQSAIIEEFFDDILTVFTVCMEFVKIFSCMINYDAKTIIGKARRKAEVLAEKLGASNSLLTAEHSARNTIAGNISVNKLCDRRHGDLSSDSKNCTKSISDSSCKSDSSMRSLKTFDSSTSIHLHRKDDHRRDRDSNIDVVGMAINSSSSNNTQAPGLNSSTNINAHTNISAILSPSSTMSEENILHLLELSLSVALLYCDIALSITYTNLREKQSGGDGARAKTVEDKKISRQD